MLFDIEKIQNIESIVSEIIKSFPTDVRCAKIVHPPCFKSLFLEGRIRNFFSHKYKVYSISQILCSVYVKKETTLLQRIIEKIVSNALGFLPVVGSFLSIVLLLADISKDIVEEKSINDIEKYLNKRWKKHKKQRKVKYIVYIDDTSALSKRELLCLQIISFLISQKYIVDSAILFAQSSDQELPYISNCIEIKKIEDTEILSDDINQEEEYVRSNLIILNIIGLDYVDKLNAVTSKAITPDKTIETIVNCIFKEKGIDLNPDLNKFLNSCSLLFEEFELKDVEFISLLQKNKDYQHLFELAQKSEVIQGINLQKFYFLQPFLREFYQQRKYAFPSEFYDNIFNYLEQKYPDSYADLAISSAILLSDDDIILSKNILAYYYSLYSMPKYKLSEISNILESYSIGATILKICLLYNENNCDLEYLKGICSTAIHELKSSSLTSEAKLASLSFIVRLYYELDIDQIQLIEISKYYRSLLAEIKIFSNVNAFPSNLNFALDYITFSTCIEEDYQTHHTVQRLETLIQKTDVSCLQREKYLKYLRLGNAIYPYSTEKAGKLLIKGYEISNGNYYIHSLFKVNYSATLILEGQYIEAIRVLEPLIKPRLQNNALNISAKNNYCVAKYLSGKNNAAKSLNVINKFSHISQQSDYRICVNNYISFKIMAGGNNLQQETKECYEIIKSNDQYHSFFAKHNILVIFFLTKNPEFWEIIDNYSVPYLLKHYEILFCEKIRFLKNNFDKNLDINQLTSSLNLHLRNNGFAEISHFYSLPVLFGLIERWFE